MGALLAQRTRFGSVGLVGLVVVVAIFNILIATVFRADAVHERPLIAKIISTSVAIVVNWIGNRTWTFGSSSRQWLREGAEFAAVSVGGMFVSLPVCRCLTTFWVSRVCLPTMLRPALSGSFSAWHSVFLSTARGAFGGKMSPRVPGPGF